MDYRSIFLSESYGRKVASTRCGQLQGRSGHSAIHATDRRLAGLGNPFDVTAALKASASYLRDLRARFRQSWARGCGLQRRSATGSGLALRARRLAKGDAPLRPDCHGPFGGGMVESGQLNEDRTLSERVPCWDVVKSISYRAAARLDSGIAKTPSDSWFPHAKPGWGVQLIGSPSQASALASFQQMQKAYKTFADGTAAARYPIRSRNERFLVSRACCYRQSRRRRKIVLRPSRGGRQLFGAAQLIAT